MLSLMDAGIQLLPAAVLTEVFECETTLEQTKLRRVCKLWNQVLSSDGIQRTLKLTYVKHNDCVIEDYTTAACLHNCWTAKTKTIVFTDNDDHFAAKSRFTSATGYFLQVINGLQSADPRPFVHYRGKKWSAADLASLEVPRLTKLTAHVLRCLIDDKEVFLTLLLDKWGVPIAPIAIPRLSQRNKFWLKEGIVVKIVKFNIGLQYLHKKGVITEIRDERTAWMKLYGSGEVLRIDQDDVQNVVPPVGRTVLMINGPFTGHYARFLSIDETTGTVSVQLRTGFFNGEVLKKVEWEDICKLDQSLD